MKQKLINIVGFIFIGLNITAVVIMAYVYFQHRQYKEERLENNGTYIKSLGNINHPRCHEGNFWSSLFNN